MFQHTQSNTYTSIFMAALLARAEDGKPPKCLSVDWLNNGTFTQWNILNPRKEWKCSLWADIEGSPRSTVGEK